MPVDIVSRRGGNKVRRRTLRQIALKVLDLVGESQAELSLVLVDNKEIQKLNMKFRHKDSPTDVLSFPAEPKLPAGVRLLGDVIISVEKAQHQAKERGRTLQQEVVTLLIHGVLHLLGHDHERSARDARIMGRLEKKIYRALCEQGTLPL